MKQKSIVASVRFKGEISQMPLILFLNNIFERVFENSFTELNYTIIDKSTSSWKRKIGTLKNNTKGIKKYEEILKTLTKFSTLDFELLSNLKDYDYKSRDIDISALYAKNEISSLNFICNYEKYKNVQIKDFIISVVNFLKDEKCQVVYGIVTCIENIKNPSFYIEGIGNGELSNEEQKKLNIWMNNKHNCYEKIWDIFDVNIISRGHLINRHSLLDNIQEVVGINNFTKIDEDIYCFSIGKSFFENDPNKVEIRKKLQKIFEHYDMLMT